MADIRDAKVPDLGSSSDVPVIELLVAVGDRVKKDQGLVTLESDKATMEVPAPFAGIVREITVKLGDALSEGHVVARIEIEEGVSAPAAVPVAAPTPAAKPAAAP
ncbi:MAG TPA: branched-chain alpha-keto acid dehydrogenase subunit E2, partial [Xanthomonadaceae bacterium]|nr:branched-chain alpha-keto acid dehydrogenase subunit E2 [Xanthomonadaceae bacterium]